MLGCLIISRILIIFMKRQLQHIDVFNNNRNNVCETKRNSSVVQSLAWLQCTVKGLICKHLADYPLVEF